MRSQLISMLAVMAALLVGSAAAFAQDATPAASPVAGVAVEELCTAVVPASSLPAGEAYVDFWRATFQPGTVADFGADVLVPSAGIDCILDGAYGLRLDGPLAVARGEDGTQEAVSLGTEVTASAGDVVIYLDNGQPQTVRTVGDVPAEVVSVVVFSTGPPPCASTSCPAYPAGITSEGLGQVDALAWAKSGLADQDLVISLRRVTVDPDTDTALPPSAETWPTLRFIEAGTLTWSIDRAGDAATPDIELSFRPGSPMLYVKPQAGDLVLLRNDGKEPVVFLEVTITPAAATPAG